MDCANELKSREYLERGQNAGESNPMWRGGIQTYRVHRKEACERCSSTQHLLVHHRNEDRYDNRIENLETLCKRCHQFHHMEQDAVTGRWRKRA